MITVYDTTATLRYPPPARAGGSTRPWREQHGGQERGLPGQPALVPSRPVLHPQKTQGVFAIAYGADLTATPRALSGARRTRKQEGPAIQEGHDTTWKKKKNLKTFCFVHASRRGRGGKGAGVAAGLEHLQSCSEVTGTRFFYVFPSVSQKSRSRSRLYSRRMVGYLFCCVPRTRGKGAGLLGQYTCGTQHPDPAACLAVSCEQAVGNCTTHCSALSSANLVLFNF